MFVFLHAPLVDTDGTTMKSKLSESQYKRALRALKSCDKWSDTRTRHYKRYWHKNLSLRIDEQGKGHCTRHGNLTEVKLTDNYYCVTVGDEKSVDAEEFPNCSDYHLIETVKDYHFINNDTAMFYLFESTAESGGRVYGIQARPVKSSDYALDCCRYLVADIPNLIKG